MLVHSHRRDPFSSSVVSSVPTPRVSNALTDARVSTSRVSNHVTNDDLSLCRRIVRRSGGGFRVAVLHALFDQVAMPEITRFVQISAGYLTNATSRLESTKTFAKTMLQHGPASVEGQAALEKVRQVHHELGISPNAPEFEYVIYTLSFKLLERLGRISEPPPTSEEHAVWFKVWRSVGIALGASSIPEDYLQFVEKNRMLELSQKNLSQPLCRQVAVSVLDQAYASVPPPIRQIVQFVVVGSLEPDVLDALGIVPKTPLQRKIAIIGMKFAVLLQDVIKLARKL